MQFVIVFLFAVAAMGCHQTVTPAEDGGVISFDDAEVPMDDAGDSDSGNNPAADAGADACTNVNYYLDADNDGWGDSTVIKRRCEQPEGYVAVGGDCQDNISEVHPEIGGEWYSDPYIARDGFESFDYDCDGLVEHQYYPDPAATCGTESPECTDITILRSDPDEVRCGMPIEVLRCDPATCEESVEATEQNCR